MKYKNNDAPDIPDKNKDKKDAETLIRKILSRPSVPPKHDVDEEMQIESPDLPKATPVCTATEPKAEPTPILAKPTSGKPKARPQVTFEDVEMVDDKAVHESWFASQ